MDAVSTQHFDSDHTSVALYRSSLAGVAFALAQRQQSRGDAQAQDSTQLTPKEWGEFEENLKNIPYYIFRIERGRALALLRIGLETRPSGAPWGILAVMLCSVDGERRRQLEGDQRVTAYRESRECLQPFHSAALSRPQQSPADSEVRADVESLQAALAEAAVEAGEAGLAKSLAASLLEQNTDRGSWNYGNIVHNANQVLGRVALREGKITEAKQHLLQAGTTPGSASLNSFGPQLFLARELLERGEREVVLEYLDLVGRFWMKSRLAELDQWKQEIAQGKIPASTKWR